MSQIEAQFYADAQAAPAETFCTYLAKQLIAKMGFEIARFPEVKRLYDSCEVVLARSDGYALSILCLVDREARPNAIFGMGMDALEEIGEACLKYTGKINRQKMPVTIRVLEIGPGSEDQQRRLRAFRPASLFAKIIPFAMTVDTVTGEVWTSRAKWFSRPYKGFVEKLLAAPRETGLTFAPPVVATAPPSFPFMTTGILLALLAIFAAEITFGIGHWTRSLEPTNATLVAFGGMMQNLVLQSGEWYRLFSAPFLHADAGHLAMNMVALFLAGRALEPLIGRAWFGAIYVASALTGSLLSLVLNPPTIIAVGASGAIMGLFAAMLVVSARSPAGPVRTRLQMNAIYVLVPSLLPLAGFLKGQKVDYAAHFGGAIGGTIVGLALLALWPRSEKLPALRPVATAIAMAGVLALAYPALSIPRSYHHRSAVAAQLIPDDKLPKTNAEIRSHATELIAQYPSDPRPRYFRAYDLLVAKDSAGAEREARAGLAEEDTWRLLLTPQLGNSLRVMLALAINGNRREEALQTAHPACEAFKDGPFRKLLDERKLCGT